MPGLKIDMKGLDKTLAKLDMKKFNERVEDEIHGFGLDVERDAKLLCPVDEGLLKGSIFQDPKEMSVVVGVRADYAAYVEFGTGRFAAAEVAKLPPEWQEYARTYYVNGKGRLPAQPFFYPAYEENRLQLIKNLKELLNA